MVRVQRTVIVLVGVLGLVIGLSYPTLAVAQQQQQAPAAEKLSPEALDKLLAPIALYPDQLLVQIFICSTSPFQMRSVSEWLEKNPDLRGSALQEAGQAEGFDPSYVALLAFPQVVRMLAADLEWTRQIGQAFQNDREGLLQSAQRLRSQAAAVGNLKTTPQQEVKTETTPDGTQVIIIQPANPEVIYVPQYNPQVVYVQSPPTTQVVVVEDNSDEAAAAVIGFTAGVIIGAASNPYYWGWGPYPYYGGAGYWYAEAWDDWYDHREDMFEDWSDHRQDMAGERTERQGNRQDNRTERQGNRQENQGGRQEDRAGQQEGRQEDRSGRQDGREQDRSTRQEGRQGGDDALQGRRDAAAQRQTDRSASGAQNRGSDMSSRGYGQDRGQLSQQRSGSSSGAFSGYGGGSSTRSSSSRGRSSSGGMSRSGGRSGGGRRR